MGHIDIALQATDCNQSIKLFICYSMIYRLRYVSFLTNEMQLS